jgi:CopG family transcriptional regulator / antitoxin EndoAI
MRTEKVRISVTLPRELIESVNQIVDARSRSRLIAESLREHIRQIKNSDLEKHPEEGYRASANEGSTLAREFEAADLEGWDEEQDD